MERIDAAQARDHIEMVDRILHESSQDVCYGGIYFVVWGLYSACAILLYQIVSNGLVPVGALWLQAVLLAGAIAFSVIRGRAKQKYVGRLTFVQREYFFVLWITLGLALVANLGAYNLFNNWGRAAVWTYAAAIVLFFIAFHGNRRASIAGLVVVASLIAANFAPPMSAGYILAAGMLLGYSGFGLAEMLVHD